MLFQTLDDKKECVGVYYNNILNFETIPDGLSKTWSYSPFLKGKNIDYGNLYVEGKSISEICPDHLKNEFENVSSKLKSFLNSFFEAKISLKENCFFNLVPRNFLINYCEMKNKICTYVFENYKKPQEYIFFRRFNELMHDIKYRKLNLDLDSFKNSISSEKDIEFYQKIINYSDYIDYNIYGTITGRLTTEKNSFPIHTFQKSYRHVLKPQNDWFVSFDMNAAELRTSLALIQKNLPEEDLHEIIAKEIFNNSLSRAESKQLTTAWLYNSNNPKILEYSEKLNILFEKENLLNKYWDGKYVYTPFNRKIESDKHNAISHLNQSTFIDLFHRQVLKIDDYLMNHKSFVSFLLHDEFVLDMCDEEKSSLIDIIKILQDTEFGKYLVNIKVGKNFGDMKKIKLKV